MTLDEMKQEAAKLSPTERAELAQALIESLEAPSDEIDMAVDDGDLDEEWLAEIKRRSAKVDSGEARLIPGDEAIASVRRLIE